MGAASGAPGAERGRHRAGYRENEGPAICGAGPIMEYLDETRGYAVADRRLMPDHPMPVQKRDAWSSGALASSIRK